MTTPEITLNSGTVIPQLGLGRGVANSTVAREDIFVTRIGEAHGKSPAQVLIRWHLQNGLIVIPKSVHDNRIAQNIDVFDFALTDEDLAALATLDDGARVGFHPDEMNLGAPN